MKINFLKTNSFFLILVLMVCVPRLARARMEYALEHHIVSCTACHVSPLGAGLRNVDGKLFGSRFDMPGEWSRQDLWSVDARAISYYPQGGTNSRQGTALMMASGGVNIPVQKKQNGSELRFAANYSVGVVLEGPRDIYGMWQSGPIEESPYYVQIGRINAPFGILTDEHRTFTKLLTRTEIFDFEFGGLLSKDIQNFHYDFAVSNGAQTGGQFNSNTPASGDATSAGFLNARWMPSSVPIVIGVSGDYQNRILLNRNPYAVATYFGISLDRMTKNSISGSLLAEAVYAEHFADPIVNPSNINRYFVPQSDTSYLATIADAPAIAWTTQLNLNLFTRWVAQYKLESLTFNPQYSGDRYLRHGVGFKYYADSNIIIMSRYEFADVGRPEIKGQNVYAAENAYWAMLQLWL
jgi:hypothetical protein